MISELLQNYNNYMEIVFNNNQMLIGLVTTMITGYLMFIFKTVPSKTYNFLLKHTTKTLEVSSDTKMYSDIMEYLGQDKIVERARSLGVQNGLWGWEKKFTLTIGVGRNWFIFNKSLIHIHIFKETNASDRVIRTMNMRVFNHPNKTLTRIVTEAGKLKERPDRTNIYRISDNIVKWYTHQQRYMLSDYIIPTAAEQAIKNILQFADSKEHYKRIGAPYKYGLLLYGLPGTGKTKLVKVLAGELGWDILEIQSPMELKNISQITEPTIVVMEEVDRIIEAGKKNNDDDDDESSKMIAAMMTGSILTAIDGISELSNVIIIMTTNNIDSLDKAILRSGRMDDKIELGYLTMEDYKRFRSHYYPDANELEYDNYDIGNLVGSDLQLGIRNRLTVEEFDNKFIEKKGK